jgi:HK97 family phage major capsid protein
MNPEINRLHERLEAIEAQALAIKAEAERQGRPLTPDEMTRVQELFVQFDRTEAELRLAMPRQRQTDPGEPGGRVPGETAGRHAPGGGEHYALADGRIIKAYRPGDRLADDGPRERQPFNLARYAAAMWSGDWSRCRPELEVMAQQHGMTGASGGFMVPEAVSREIVDLARARSRAIQAGVRTVAMPEPVTKLAKVLNDPTVHWRPELHPIPQSTITFGEVVLEAKTAGAIILASEELLQDAPNADALFRRLLAEALAAEMDRAVFAGTGGDQPLGILNNPAVPDFPINGKFTYDAVINAITALQLLNGDPDTIVTSPQVAGSIAKLKTGISGDNTPLQPPKAWLDLNRIVSNRLPAGAGSPSNYPAILGGFEEVVLGIRLPISLAVANAGGTEHDWGDGSPTLLGDAFERYALRFRGVMRMDTACCGRCC